MLYETAVLLTVLGPPVVEEKKMIRR